MRDILPSDETLIHYLLGELSEQDQEQIEEKYFPDKGAFERLCALEDELIDRYVRTAPRRSASALRRDYCSLPNSGKESSLRGR